MARIKKSNILDSLGTPALLQLQQEHGVDVSKQLTKAGHPELVKFVATKVSPEVHVEPVNPLFRKNKYAVSSVEDRTLDGIVFASKMEMMAYQLLLDKRIKFTRQNRYVLQDAFVDTTGKKHLDIGYMDDFLLTAPDGKEYVVDIKGMRTPVFRLKQKMFLHKFGREIWCFNKTNKLLRFLIDKGFLGSSSLS